MTTVSDVKYKHIRIECSILASGVTSFQFLASYLDIFELNVLFLIVMLYGDNCCPTVQSQRRRNNDREFMLFITNTITSYRMG
jgi:hypothetical protein